MSASDSLFSAGFAEIHGSYMALFVVYGPLGARKAYIFSESAAQVNKN
jgi:hypothetical protein